MVKYYGYIIYRLYTWRLKQKDNTPFTTTELLMCSIHYFHILTLYAIIVYFFPQLDSNLNKFQVALIAAGIQLLYHLLIFNKKRWLRYVEIYQDETPKQRERGTTIVYFYTIGSIVLSFIILPLLFWGK